MSNPFSAHLEVANRYFSHLNNWQVIDVVEQEDYTLFEVAGYYLVEDRDNEDGMTRYYVADEFGNQKTDAKFNSGYAVQDLTKLVMGAR
jgi:hypothetical protein